MDVAPGESVELPDVLLLSDGCRVTGGRPTVDGAVVIAEVVGHRKGPKVINFRYKAKVRYRRKRGHRQPFTKLAVREILPSGATRTPADETAARSRPVVDPALGEPPAPPEAAAEPARRRRRAAEEETQE